jgi:hypothetical protein
VIDETLDFFATVEINEFIRVLEEVEMMED